MSDTTYIGFVDGYGAVSMVKGESHARHGMNMYLNRFRYYSDMKRVEWLDEVSEEIMCKVLDYLERHKML